MNTRIQVEHPVTEMITGIDLVQEQVRVARGEPLSFDQSNVVPRGHAIECRINAEDPGNGFRPSPGTITRWLPPEGPGIRVDSHCHEGYTVPPYYDSLLAKLIVAGDTRMETIARLQQALANFQVEGVDTTIPFLASLVQRGDFITGRINTRWLESVVIPLSRRRHAFDPTRQEATTHEPGRLRRYDAARCPSEPVERADDDVYDAAHRPGN